MILSVTYHLKSRNAINFFTVHLILNQQKIKLVVWGYRTLASLLGKHLH